MMIDTQPRKMFLIATSTYAGYFLLFVNHLFLNLALTHSIKEQMRLDSVTVILYCVNSLTYQNYTIGYMLTIYVIYFRLSLVRRFLETLEGKDLKIKHDLKNVALIVDRICDSLESTKFGYTINTVVYILHFAFFSILLVYSCLSYIFRAPSGDIDLLYSELAIAWEIYYAPLIVWIFLYSNSIQKEAQKIANLVHKLLHVNQIDAKTYERCKVIFMQMQHRHPEMSCGVFVVDLKLMFYLLGVCFSYLVIIVQFEFKEL